MKHLLATGALAAGLFAIPVSNADAQYYYGGYYYPYSYSTYYSQPSYYSYPGYSLSFNYYDRNSRSNWGGYDRHRHSRYDRHDRYDRGDRHRGHGRSNRRTY